MFREFYATVLAITTVCLVLILAGNQAWAATYSDSVVMKKGKKSKHGKIVLVKNQIEAKIRKKSLDAYLEEHDINEVEIFAEVTEEVAPCGDATHHHLRFKFGPSGAYFQPAMKLIIGMDYIHPECDLWLLDEDGNPLEGNATKADDKIIFEIDHFSTYDYIDPNYSGDDTQPYAASHFASKLMDVEGGTFHINSEASVKVKSGALAAYLEEQGKESVEITVELYYGWDSSLLFVFGPSGTHFDPELELTVQGGYVEDDMILIGPDGEEIEYTVKKKGTKLIYKVPHFSSYVYDFY